MLRTRDLDWDGGYYDPAPPGRYHRRRSFDRGYYDDGWGGPRWLSGLWLLVVGVGFVVLVAAVVGHDDPRPGLSDRSWLTLGLAASLVGLLLAHQRAGVVALLRALAEYGVLVVLVVLLATGPGAFAPAAKPAAHPPGRPQAAQQAGRASARAATARAGQHAAAAGKQAARGCPSVRQVFAWVGCLWRQAQQPHQPTPKPGPSRALPPAIPSTRRTP
jgi:hypothetical protein